MTGKEKLQKCRDIVAEHQAEDIDGVLMDAFTASAVVQVYDALNDENKTKLEGAMEKDIVKATQIVWASIERSKAV